MKLKRAIEKKTMVKMLVDSAPAQIEGVPIEQVSTLDGVKYYLNDGSWLLIRPSGTEPVLRVYAEAPISGRVRALLKFGELVAQNA